MYCHWSPILNQLEWEEGELSTIDIWWVTEQILQQLRDVEMRRDEMIPYVFKKLLKDMTCVVSNNKMTNRSVMLAEQSAVTVMSVLMFRLMNAVEEGNEEKEFENEPICVAIANIVRNHPRFSVLEKRFFKRKKGNDGKPIRIKPLDPMNIELLLGDMDSQSRKEIDEMSAKMIELTKNLKPLWGDELWKRWKELCKQICMHQDLLNKMKEVNPGNNSWKLNQKMICNTIGIFRTKKDINVSVAAINKAISSKQLSSYLRQHADYGGTDSALTREEHKRIEKLIENDNNADN